MQATEGGLIGPPSVVQGESCGEGQNSTANCKLLPVSNVKMSICNALISCAASALPGAMRRIPGRFFPIGYDY
jgi:hypothetical protein